MACGAEFADDAGIASVTPAAFAERPDATAPAL
jgi:hypothetical protein